MAQTESGIMSNQLNIVRTRFQTLDRQGQPVSTTYGIRVYDDYGNAYVNILDTLDELVALEADGLVDLAKHISDTTSDMLAMAKICEVPVFVDDERYEMSEGSCVPSLDQLRR